MQFCSFGQRWHYDYICGSSCRSAYVIITARDRVSNRPGKRDGTEKRQRMKIDARTKGDAKCISLHSSIRNETKLLPLSIPFFTTGITHWSERGTKLTAQKRMSTSWNSREILNWQIIKRWMTSYSAFTNMYILGDRKLILAFFGVENNLRTDW